MTWPVPTPPPPPRVAVTVPVKPSAANAAVLLLETDRLAAVPECRVIEPPEIVDGTDVSVIESIFASSVEILSVTLSWLPVAPDATKVMTVPLTVIVSAATAGGPTEPALKLAEIELEPARPESSVAPVLATDGVALLLCVVPLLEASV